MTQPRHEARTLAELVLALRCERGLTQAELARRASVAHRTVQNIEAGRPALPITLTAVARALGVPPGKLLGLAASEPAKAAS